MKKIKVFISSVQSEFSREKKNLFQNFPGNPLLRLFFEPFHMESGYFTIFTVIGATQRTSRFYPFQSIACRTHVSYRLYRTIWKWYTRSVSFKQ